MMLTLRCIRHRRVSVLPLLFNASNNCYDGGLCFFLRHSGTLSPGETYRTPYFPALPLLPSAQGDANAKSSAWSEEESRRKAIVTSLKEWYLSGNQALFVEIYEILRTKEDTQLDIALARLNMRLGERFVIDVLNYGRKRELVSCLKFFDWSGRQKSFHHTRATFHAMFKILSRSKNYSSLLVAFLDTYKKDSSVHRVRFYDTLVMGYAIAGKLDIALQMFGRMRFMGLNPEGISCHVLLDSLVEEGYFDAFDTIVNQMRMLGNENAITRSIYVKSLCMRREMDRMDECLKDLMADGGKGLCGPSLAILVDALCQANEFERAGMLVEDFSTRGMVPMDRAYNRWIQNLLRFGKLDGALEFLKRSNMIEGYIPDLFRYNSLICRLLRENRLEEVCDLLIEMKERDISPDDVTMNLTLCFFCKSGMLDTALELYNMKTELGLSVSSMAYNYLINTLLGEVSVDEAYQILKSAMDQGYFPGRKTFSIIADTLRREGKLAVLKDLALLALENNWLPSDFVYNKFISALCRSNRVEEGYVIQSLLNSQDRNTAKTTYLNLINGFNKSNRGDLAARLLMEMQMKGHSPNRKVYKDVVQCLCLSENAEEKVLKLLEVQLSQIEPHCRIFNVYIEGAGLAKRPDLAKKLYEMIGRHGILPNFRSDILLLTSYLKSAKITDALVFFDGLTEKRKIKAKVWNVLVAGLMRAKKADFAVKFLYEMRTSQVKPSLQCYEELVKLLCDKNKYYVACVVIDDLRQVGYQISSFIGNTLLLHCLRTREVYDAWVRSRNLENVMPSNLALGKLLDKFSQLSNGTDDTEEMEELAKECFSPDIYTYNLLLRRLILSKPECTQDFVEKLCKKGYNPNKWTYDILIKSFLQLNQLLEARKWMEEMLHKGFFPSQILRSLF